MSATAQNNNANPSATGANWKSNGNSATNVDFIGTTNAQDLIIKTNNIQRGLFDTQGKLIINDVSNTVGGIILDGGGTEGGGNGGGIKINPGLLNRPIPTNPIAAYMLKVGGSGIFEGEVNARQLFVEEYITFMKSLKGPRIDVDSIKMDSTRGIYGQTKIVGDLTVKQNLSVDGDALFRSKLIAEQGITFDGTNGIRYVTETNGSKTFVYGNNTTLRPSPISCATGPVPAATHQMGGNLQLYDPLYPNQSGLLNLQTWYNTTTNSGASSIDASIAGTTLSTGLLLNYFCGANTLINVNNGLPNRGGSVYMGEQVSMGRYVGIGYNGGVDNFSNTTALNIFANEDNQTAIKINTWNGTVKAIDVVNVDATSYFSVTQHGNITNAGTITSAGTISSNTLAGTNDRNLKVHPNGEIFAIAASTWDVLGNSGTSSTTNFIGNTDAVDLFFRTNNTPRMVIKADGKIGIGTSNPAREFELTSPSNSPAAMLVGSPTANMSSMYWAINQNMSYGFGMYSSATETNIGGIFRNINASTPEKIMTFARTTAGPQVWIGDKKPSAAPYSNATLSVDGSIVAKEIYVRDQQGAQWADYVFNKDYKLMPLKEVEKYVTENKHLPNVPSAKEIDEKGQGIGALQVVQMEKIEEAFLYIIELKKEVDNLKKENQQLKELIQK